MSTEKTSSLTPPSRPRASASDSHDADKFEDGVIIRITTDSGLFRFVTYHSQLILKPDSYTAAIRQKQDEYPSELCWMASVTTPDGLLTHSRLGVVGDALMVSAIGLRDSRVGLGVIQDTLVHRQV